MRGTRRFASTRKSSMVVMMVMNLSANGQTDNLPERRPGHATLRGWTRSALDKGATPQYNAASSELHALRCLAKQRSVHQARPACSATKKNFSLPKTRRYC